MAADSFLSGKVEGSDATIQRLKSIPDKARPVLVKTIKRLAIELQGHVKADYLSGQALKNRTGTLRRSITQSVIDDGYDVIGIVGTNVRYARIWEKGGVIPSYSRTLTEAFGKPLKNPVTATWKARTVIARPFLAPALRDNSASIKDQIKAAVIQSAQP